VITPSSTQKQASKQEKGASSLREEQTFQYDGAKKPKNCNLWSLLVLSQKQAKGASTVRAKGASTVGTLHIFSPYCRLHNYVHSSRSNTVDFQTFVSSLLRENVDMGRRHRCNQLFSLFKTLKHIKTQSQLHLLHACLRGRLLQMVLSCLRARLLQMLLPCTLKSKTDTDVDMNA
jgi:hypothetical protein